MLTYSTHGLAPSAKVAYWNDVISDVFAPLETRPSDPGGFDAEVRCLQFGRLRMANAISQPATVRRSKSQAAHLGEHRYFLHVQRQGQLHVRQENHDARLDEGDLLLSDATLPYTLTYEKPCSTLVLIVADGDLRKHLPMPEELVGVKLSGATGLSRTTSVMLKSVWEQAAAGFPPELGSRIADSLLDVFATSWSAARGIVVPETRDRRGAAHPDQALHRGQSARQRAQRALRRRRLRDLAALSPCAVRQREGNGVELHPAPPGRGMRQAARRRSVAAPHDHRNRLRLGLHQRDSFRARVPRSLRHQPARVPQRACRAATEGARAAPARRARGRGER